MALFLAFLVIGVVVALALLLAGGWIGSDRAIHPKLFEPLPDLSEYPQLQKRVEPVYFSSQDGTHLAGWFVPGPLSGPAGDSVHPAVILLHGYASNRSEMLPHADILHRAGFAVLLFDFRAQGESPGNSVTFGFLERGDVLGATDYLRTRSDVDANRIGALGVSLGGVAALLAAAESQEIKAVAIESAFSSLDTVIEQGFKMFVNLPAFPLAPLTVWITELRLGIKAAQINPAGQVHKIAPRPILVMHGELDDLVSPDAAETIFAAASEPKDLWLIPNGIHAHGALVVGEEYARRIAAFFDNSLRMRI